MNILKNIGKTYRSPQACIGMIFGIAFIAVPSYFFVEKDVIVWNLGYTFFLLEIILNTIIALLFWLFIWGTIYKIQYFNVKKSGVWLLGWFLGILVSGCPACSITFASYVWLASIIWVFPYYGLELKILSVFLLVYANYSIFNNLEVCKIKTKK